MSDDRTQYEQRRDLALSKMTAAEREDFHERAGICQHDGGLTRVAAECEAFRIVTGALRTPDRELRAMDRKNETKR